MVVPAQQEIIYCPLIKLFSKFHETIQISMNVVFLLFSQVFEFSSIHVFQNETRLFTFIIQNII